MPFAALLLPALPLQALLRDEPALAGRAVAVTEGEGRRARVLHAAASAVGLEPDLPVTLALSRCPGLVLQPRRPAAETEAQRLLLAAAFALSPRVENTRGGLVTVDLQGAEPSRVEAAARALLASLVPAGLTVRIGVADTPLLAELAASSAADYLAVRDSRAFLAPLPLAAAGPRPDHAELLAKWGVHTLGDLCALPKGDVAQRLGTEGVALWERAAGEATRVLHLVEPARTFAAAWDCETPVETLEPLLFRLQRYGERLAAELRAGSLVASSLALTLLLEDETELRREFRLPEPCGDAAVWLRVLHSHLGTVRTSARIAGLRLTATPVRPPQRQEGLFETGLRDPLAFWETLARVAALVGPEAVGMPVLADTHRPDRLHLARPPETLPPPGPAPVHPNYGYVLRRYRPPRPVQVMLEQGQPVALLAPEPGGAITAVAGPWLTGGDWWSPEAWWEETWHIQLADRSLYQLSRRAGGWALDGELD